MEGEKGMDDEEGMGWIGVEGDEEEGVKVVEEGIKFFNCVFFIFLFLFCMVRLIGWFMFGINIGLWIGII